MSWTPSRYREPESDEDKLLDPWWRLNNLYRCLTKKGEDVPFQCNAVQARYYWSQWYCDLILKSRQHGFSTLLILVALDLCIFTENFFAHIIAHTRDDAEALFDKKARWPLEQLRDQFPELRRVTDTEDENARILSFPNGSRLTCGTSMRGGTLQWLHISEHGKICAAFPDKAREIRSGSLNTLAPGQFIKIESTAEGRDGDFFDYAELARKRMEAKAELSELDFKFHFVPWWKDASNVLNPRGVVITEEMEAYFREHRVTNGIRLTPGQKAWYTRKFETQRDLMFREHPTTPQEAFQGAQEGAYYGKAMIQARRQGRIFPFIPFDPKLPVDTAWDLGKNDSMAVWWHQYLPREGIHRWLKYEEGISEGLAYWVRLLREVAIEFNFVYGRHYLPHDVEVSELSMAKGETRADFLHTLGMGNIVVVERVPNLMDGIEAVRNILPTSVFCEKKASKGIAHLENYRRDWDERTGSFKDSPAKTPAIHGADAFRQLAQEWYPDTTYRARKPRDRNWRRA